MRPFALLVYFLKDIRVHKPSMQFLPANPEWILQILSGPCTKTIERHRKRRDFHLAHAALLFIRRQKTPDPFSYEAVASWPLPGISLTGRTSMVPNRTDGNLEATWIASFRSRALIRKKPPSCSFVSAWGPSVTDNFPLRILTLMAVFMGSSCSTARS